MATRKNPIKLNPANAGKLRKTAGVKEGREHPGRQAATAGEVEEPDHAQARTIRPQRIALG